MYIGIQIYLSHRKEEREKHNKISSPKHQQYESERIGRDGKVYRYTISNKKEGRIFSAIGGTFVGMISVGLGELLDYHLVSRCKVPTPVAVATSVFCVVITVLSASFSHFIEFFVHSSEAVRSQVTGIVVFTIPGVLIGGQIGPVLQRVIPEAYLKVGLSVLFIFIAFLMTYSLVVGA